MRTALNRIKRRHKPYMIFIVGSLAHHSNSVMMASFIRARCHAAILFLLVASAVGSPSGASLRAEYLARKKEASVRAEAMKTSATVPANPVETSTETAARIETASMVFPATVTQPPSENPLLEMIELQKSQNEEESQLNISRSEDSASSSPTMYTPKYKQEQHDASTRRPGIMPNASRATQRYSNRATTTPIPELFDKDKLIGSEREDDGTLCVEDLLTPIPQSVYLLAQLMSLSLQNLDTTFRGSVKNQSPIVQYGHSFRTTLLQISQKLSNAFLVSRTNADKIKMYSLFVPSKVKEAAGYLEKFENSSRMVEFLYLPLKNLKETADQTFNLSSQISNQFGELVELVDAVITSHNSSKLNKEQQVKNTTAELQSANYEKKKMEREIIAIEYDVNNLKREKQSDEASFNNALGGLKHLQDRKADESGCYWAYNWLTVKRDWWYCPYKPDPSEFREGNEIARKAQIKLEKTMKSLSAKEEEAAKTREVDNELLIRIERLSHEMHQLNEDVQLLGKTSDPLRELTKNFKNLDKSWNKFVTICVNGQSSATKGLNIIKEANCTSTNWSSQLSERILLNLNKTKEDLSLAKTFIDFYLEGSSGEHILEIVAEVEQMMMKRENPNELEISLKQKCDLASREIKNISKRNQDRTITQPSPQIQKRNQGRRS